MSVWTQPSPSDFDRWEQRLLDGEEPSTAAKAEGQTCSAFKRTDPVRHAEALAMSRETRAHYADERVEKWVEPDDASDAVKLAWAKRWQPAYGGTQRVELTGAEGGPVQIEGRAVVGLADVNRLATELGLGDLVGLNAGDTRRQLAAAPDLLPDP